MILPCESSTLFIVSNIDATPADLTPQQCSPQLIYIASILLSPGFAQAEGLNSCWSQLSIPLAGPKLPTPMPPINHSQSASNSPFWSVFLPVLILSCLPPRNVRFKGLILGSTCSHRLLYFYSLGYYSLLRCSSLHGSAPLFSSIIRPRGGLLAPIRPL